MQTRFPVPAWVFAEFSCFLPPWWFMYHFFSITDRNPEGGGDPEVLDTPATKQPLRPSNTVIPSLSTLQPITFP